MINNLVKLVLENGGSIKPLIIPSQLTGGYGLCNPTIYNDNGKLLINIRNVRYTLHHNEGSQKFQSAWSGPLQYLHPENDRTLTTNNFLCELNPKTLEIISSTKLDTSKLDVTPLWEFIGLEDGRLVKWDNDMYLCGVRRDTTTNGEGRMELSKIVDGKEISRHRINLPKGSPYLYCEKNWMPVIDLPFHFIKWSNPVEVVKVNIEDNSSEYVFNGAFDSSIPNNLRGGSQVITVGDYYVTLTHEVYFPYNPQGHKDATYKHRLIVWDKNWNVVDTSQDFNFMTGLIEFSCGMCVHDDKILITYGFQDNSAFILEIPMVFFKNLINVDNKFSKFNWGILKEHKWFYERLQEEFVLGNLYERFFSVEPNDVVVDIGASVGPFTFSILEKNPKKVFCIEPQPNLYKTLTSNFFNNENVICTNTAISDTDGVSDITGIYNPTGYFTGDTTQKSDSCKFNTFIYKNKITKIDFLKTDCEGGEYDIFNSENYGWIIKNVRKIVGEFHLGTPEFKEKFRSFRDTYLKFFENIEVYSMDNVDIKWDLFNENFITRYSEVMIYINNEKRFIGDTLLNKSESKFKNFPTAYCVTLKDSYQRQEDMSKQFDDLGIKYKMVEAYDGRVVDYKNNPLIEGSNYDFTNSGDMAATMSHLEAIKSWYNDTDEDYGFFCEDDVRLTNSNLWSFKWDEFVKKLPKKWRAIQLSLIRNEDEMINDETFIFEQRKWFNFSAASYIITREYAKYLLDNFYTDKFYFNIILTDGQKLRPIIENIIFAINNPNIYTIPLFFENTSTPSTFYPLFIDNQHKISQYESAESVNNWWEKNKDKDQLSIFFNTSKDYWRTTKYPTMEFTTSIPPKGCVVDCAFCPQKTLVNVYNGEKTMTFENFKMVVDKLPKEVRITFSGFTEPWLNTRCTDMLIYAHEQGHPVSAFSTGIGMTIDDVKRIKNIPFTEGPNGGFCLHVPDEEYIAKHPITKRYIEVLEYFKEVQHEIKGFYLMSMGEVKKDLQYIFPTAHTPEMWSRAGNLLGEAIIKPELYKIRDRFKHMYHGDVKMTCGCIEDLYHNVVLPNGDVSLCCMDYGLTQIIGNIFTEEYNDIIPKPNTCFSLCQKCENGIKPKN